MTGWRVGWMIGPADVIAAAINLQSHQTSNVADVSAARRARGGVAATSTRSRRCAPRSTGAAGSCTRCSRRSRASPASSRRARSTASRRSRACSVASSPGGTPTTHARAVRAAPRRGEGRDRARRGVRRARLRPAVLRPRRRRPRRRRRAHRQVPRAVDAAPVRRVTHGSRRTPRTYRRSREPGRQAPMRRFARVGLVADRCRSSPGVGRHRRRPVAGGRRFGAPDDRQDGDRRCQPVASTGRSHRRGAHRERSRRLPARVEQLAGSSYPRSSRTRSTSPTRWHPSTRSPDSPPNRFRARRGRASSLDPMKPRAGQRAARRERARGHARRRTRGRRASRALARGARSTRCGVRRRW